MPGKRVGYRPRRSGATPTVAQPEGPKPHELKIIALLHPEAMANVTQAVSAVFRYRLGDPFEQSAEEVTSTFITRLHGKKWDAEAWLNWKTILNVVKDIAVADPRYYGIRDPVTEQYCSKCRKVKKLNEFPPGRIRCYECEERSGYAAV